MCCGILGWPPDVFWKYSTPIDTLGAEKAYAESQGKKSEEPPNAYEVRRLKALNPDKPEARKQRRLKSLGNKNANRIRKTNIPT